MQPVEICGQHGYKTMTDLNASGISPWEAWLTIKQLKQPPEPEPELPPEPEVKEPPTLEQGEQETEELWPEDIPGTGEVLSAKEEAQAAALAHIVPSQPEQKPVGETKGFPDMARLEEQLKTLQAKGLKAWTERNLLSYIKTTYRVEGKTVLEAVAKLDKGAASHFIKRVQETLQML